MIPIVDVSVPLLVAKIFLINIIVFVAFGEILNAVVIKNTHDMPRRNRTRFLKMLFMPRDFIC
jgi:hypothetical protein